MEENLLCAHFFTSSDTVQIQYVLGLSLSHSFRTPFRLPIHFLPAKSTQFPYIFLLSILLLGPHTMYNIHSFLFSVSTQCVDSTNQPFHNRIANFHVFRMQCTTPKIYTRTYPNLISIIPFAFQLSAPLPPPKKNTQKICSTHRLLIQRICRKEPDGQSLQRHAFYY